MGSDCVGCVSMVRRQSFQSTLPLWGATGGHMLHIVFLHISIHAPLVGSDSQIWELGGGREYFNPRSPCGERPAEPRPPRFKTEISIHAPLVGSDSGENLEYQTRALISIHAPLVGSDLNPRGCPAPSGISIHASLVGSDLKVPIELILGVISIHAPLVGSDRLGCLGC